MISPKDLIKTSLQGLQVHKGRSILTALGIVIGIAAIMIVMAIGGSARDLIIGEVQVFGPDIVTINAGRQPSGPSDIAQAILKDSLKLGDVRALENKNNVPDAVMVNPVVDGSVAATYGSEIAYTTLMGAGAGVFDLFKISAGEGMVFSQSDVDGHAAVVVLGKKVADELFGAQDPLGEKIKIKGKNYTVIGIASPQSASFFGLDDMIITPYTTARQYVLGIRYFHEIDIKASSPDKVNVLVQDIKRTLRDQHNIDDPSKDDFYVNTPDDIIKSITSVFDAITAFLGLVAAISLVVGGVGVMNIMLISVTERRHEIGLRKALGATNKNIMNQFLAESVVLSAAGGVGGIITGLVMTWLITVVAGHATGIAFPFVVSIPGILLGLAVSGIVGVVFGVFPARGAAKKSPIEALRYE